MEVIEDFPEVDFSSIKLNLIAATSSLLQTSSEDVNVEDDATTLPLKDNPKVDAPLLRKYFNVCVPFSFFFFFFNIRSTV